MLYANDTMLFLGDTSDFLREAMLLIAGFGVFSSLVMNWTKSSVMPLDSPVDNQGPILHNISIASSLKYLGVYVTPQPRDYVFLNLSPLFA